MIFRFGFRNWAQNRVENDLGENWSDPNTFSETNVMGMQKGKKGREMKWKWMVFKWFGNVKFFDFALNWVMHYSDKSIYTFEYMCVGT